MNAERRTLYAAVVADAEAKAAKHTADRDALDPRSRTYKTDYQNQTRWIEAQLDKADRHRRIMEEQA